MATHPWVELIEVDSNHTLTDCIELIWQKNVFDLAILATIYVIKFIDRLKADFSIAFWNRSDIDTFGLVTV